ncbi:MAG TPA: hypothetical protein VFA04_02565 [Bryobacteraceae bacterium]|nr:hypothetical protein [Bryobacteraceae bacterium]
MATPVPISVNLENAGEIDRVAEQILRYLSLHPGASDTIVGVRQFWLQNMRPAPSVRLVLDALQALVSKGLVSESRSQAAETLYRAKEE